MTRYTILLLRPDYLADAFGQDTYLTHVSEPSVEAAQHAARVEVSEADSNEDFEDYHVLAVFEGHLEDLKTGT